MVVGEAVGEVVAVVGSRLDRPCISAAVQIGICMPACSARLAALLDDRWRFVLVLARPEP